MRTQRCTAFVIATCEPRTGHSVPSEIIATIVAASSELLDDFNVAGFSRTDAAETIGVPDAAGAWIWQGTIGTTDDGQDDLDVSYVGTYRVANGAEVSALQRGAWDPAWTYVDASTAEPFAGGCKHEQLVYAVVRTGFADGGVEEFFRGLDEEGAAIYSAEPMHAALFWRYDYARMCCRDAHDEVRPIEAGVAFYTTADVAAMRGDLVERAAKEIGRWRHRGCGAPIAVVEDDETKRAIGFLCEKCQHAAGMLGFGDLAEQLPLVGGGVVEHACAYGDPPGPVTSKSVHASGFAQAVEKATADLEAHQRRFYEHLNTTFFRGGVDADNIPDQDGEACRAGVLAQAKPTPEEFGVARMLHDAFDRGGEREPLHSFDVLLSSEPNIALKWLALARKAVALGAHPAHPRGTKSGPGHVALWSTEDAKREPSVCAPLPQVAYVLDTGDPKGSGMRFVQTIDSSGLCYLTAAPQEAIHFARRTDAERLAVGLVGGFATVAEVPLIETAWLIELPAGTPRDADDPVSPSRTVTLYMRARSEWTADVSRAVRFARAEDAQAMLPWDSDVTGAVVREHMWTPPANAVTLESELRAAIENSFIGTPNPVKPAWGPSPLEKIAPAVRAAAILQRATAIYPTNPEPCATCGSCVVAKNKPEDPRGDHH